MLLLTLPYKASAISAAIKKKYPYTLLTNDYGILNDLDLDTRKSGVNPAPFLPKEGEGIGYIYWQCFPRDRVSLSLEDIGYSSEDIGGDENYGSLSISVSSESGLHKYCMRRMWPVSGYEERFNLWIRLMKDQKYVCFSGGFFGKEDSMINGKKQKTYSWVFDKIKTKKGCDSYFERDCYVEKSKG